MIPHAWTEENEAILRRMWSLYSTNAIVRHFESLGAFFTRNAIIGKAHRLGLAHKDHPELKRRVPRTLSAAAAKRKTGPTPRARKPASPAPKPIGTAPPVSPIPFTPRVVDTGPLHLTLLELTEATCKYECSGLDDPVQFRFCGKPSEAGPYCPAHHAICRQPAAHYRPAPKYNKRVAA